MSATGLGQIAAAEGDVDLARTTLGEGLTALSMSETSWSLPLVLRGLVDFEIATEHPLRAAQLLGAAEAIRARLGAPLGRAE